MAVHGWVHEVLYTLDAIEAERILTDAVAAFRNLGIEPEGFRAPGGKRGEFTLPILKKLGLSYDSSVDHAHDDRRMLPTPTQPLRRQLSGRFLEMFLHRLLPLLMHPLREKVSRGGSRHYLERFSHLEIPALWPFIFHPFASCQMRSALSIELILHAQKKPEYQYRNGRECGRNTAWVTNGQPRTPAAHCPASCPRIRSPSSRSACPDRRPGLQLRRRRHPGR